MSEKSFLHKALAYMLIFWLSMCVVCVVFLVVVLQCELQRHFTMKHNISKNQRHFDNWIAKDKVTLSSKEMSYTIWIQKETVF